jgi:hypothetical protein
VSNYKLYTDREENFNCDISLEGARLKDSFARIILESSNVNLVFNGTIDASGKCAIPIKPLKHLLENNDTGKMILEVIADDTYFSPWESEFVVDSFKKLEVKINESSIPNKPKISVSVVKPTKEKIIETPKKKTKTLTMRTIVSELKNDLSSNGVTATNIKSKKKVMSERITNYFTKKKIDNKYKTKILTKLVESILKG